MGTGSWVAWVGVLLLGAIAPPVALSVEVRSEPAAPVRPPLASDSAIEITLPELLNLIVQNNRELKNAVLARIVQRQELREAESKFNPRITPTVAVTVTRQWSALGGGSGFSNLNPLPLTTADPGNAASEPLNSGVLGGVVERDDPTAISRSAQVLSTVQTRVGTQVRLTVDPLVSDAVGLTVTQPLLRGMGRAVNEASVNQARLTETKNQLQLRRTLIERLTDGITGFTELIQNQELVRIQELALQRKRQQLEITQALVAAGRQARVDLVVTEKSIADSDRDLLGAQNRLSQTNTRLLNLIGTDTPYRLVAPAASIAQLLRASQTRMAQFQYEALLQAAYDNRPDYRQAQLDVETERLNLIVAQDNRRWSLDAIATLSLGDTSQAAAGVRLGHTLGDESLETEFQRRRVGVLQNQTTLAQLTETIRNEVRDRLNDVSANQKQLESAQTARTLAEQQLDIAKEKFRRGIEGIDIFEVIRQEDALVQAQNSELQAQIALLNSIATLDQGVGLTLATWLPQVDLSPVLSDVQRSGEASSPEPDR